MKDSERIRASGIAVLVENELLEQIQNVYDDIETTVKLKKEQRKKYTEQFILKYANELELPEDKVRSIVDFIISKTRWIKEIEEMEEVCEVPDDGSGER